MIKAVHVKEPVPVPYELRLQGRGVNAQRLVLNRLDPHLQRRGVVLRQQRRH